MLPEEILNNDHPGDDQHGVQDRSQIGGLASRSFAPNHLPCGGMREEHMMDPNSSPGSKNDVAELDLSDEDILDAMRHVPGYLDISTVDFRAIYHLAHAHAMERLFRHISAGSLMRTGIEPLHPYTKLDAAARSLVKQGLKSLPVVDINGRVIGVLSETDYLRSLKADSFLELLLSLILDQKIFTHRCGKVPVSDAMTAPAVTINAGADFREIARAFHRHEGRGMPVVDAAGRLEGLLLRKDFVKAYPVEELS